MGEEDGEGQLNKQSAYRIEKKITKSIVQQLIILHPIVSKIQ